MLEREVWGWGLGLGPEPQARLKSEQSSTCHCLCKDIASCCQVAILHLKLMLLDVLISKTANQLCHEGLAV